MVNVSTAKRASLPIIIFTYNMTIGKVKKKRYLGIFKEKSNKTY